MRPSLTRITALLFAWFAIAEPAAPPITATDVPWKQGVNEIALDGLMRAFLLDLPDHWQRGAAPVMVFHGSTGNAEDMRKEAGFTRLVSALLQEAALPKFQRPIASEGSIAPADRLLHRRRHLAEVVATLGSQLHRIVGEESGQVHEWSLVTVTEGIHPIGSPCCYAG
uniref:hypothetical protein n=1 Tax=Prosthecobacter sp. TaxID=1965333 RepID=UPI0037835B89